MKSKTKRVLVFIGLVLIAAIVIGIKISGFSEKEFKENLKKGDWTGVVNTYNNHIAKDKVLKEKYQPIIKNEIDDVVNKWGDGDYKFEKSEDILLTCEEFDDDKLSSLSTKNWKYITIEEEGSKFLRKAEKKYNKEKYLESLQDLQRIDKKYSQYSAVTSLKDECKEIILMVVEYPNSKKEYDDDVAMIAKAYKATGDSDYNDKQSEMKNERKTFEVALPAMEDTGKAYDYKEYKKAFKTISEALGDNPNNRFLQNCFEEYHNRYVVKIFEKVDKKIDKKEYAKAKKIVNEAYKAHKCGEFDELSEHVDNVSNPFKRISGTIEEIYTKCRTMIKKEKYKTYEAGSGSAYIIKSGKKLLLGDYSKEEVTLLSGAGRGVLSMCCLDFPLYIRDLSYDLVHFGEDDYFAFNLTADAIALVSVFGTLKYLKYSDEIAKGTKIIKMLGKTKSAVKIMKSIKKLSKKKWVNNESAEKITKIKSRHYEFRKTINQRYKGKYHPKTKVLYKERRITYSDGRKIKAVFPQFKSKSDIRLPKDHWKVSFDDQKTYLNKELKKKIDKNAEFRKKFSKKDIIRIEKGKLPKKYTWHHNEREGWMQLVDAKTHGATRHTGGMKFWGKGY